MRPRGPWGRRQRSAGGPGGRTGPGAMGEKEKKEGRRRKEAPLLLLRRHHQRPAPAAARPCTTHRRGRAWPCRRAGRTTSTEGRASLVSDSESEEVEVEKTTTRKKNKRMIEERSLESALLPLLLASTPLTRLKSRRARRWRRERRRRCYWPAPGPPTRRGATASLCQGDAWNFSFLL